MERWRRLLSPGAYGARLRRGYIVVSELTGLSRVLQALRGRFDLLRLRRRRPALVDFDPASADDGWSFREHYECYVGEVSPPNMAASKELCLYLGYLCESQRPRRILDLGSGVSSALFRFHQRSRDSFAEVLSIDDSEEWLSATRAFLRSRGLPEGDLSTWSEFIARDEVPEFDLIFHDLGDLQTRADALPHILRVCHSGSLVVLDDLHSQFYRSSLWRFLRRRRSEVDVYSLRQLTLDRWGRYSMLLVSKEGES